MRRHTIWGEELLPASAWFTTARQIARSHHENWDGTGYPDGLKGNQIPLAATIVSVADGFDAMTSKRPYKGAWPPARAMREAQERPRPQVLSPGAGSLRARCRRGYHHAHCQRTQQALRPHEGRLARPQIWDVSRPEIGNRPHIETVRLIASSKRPLRREDAMSKSDDIRYKALAHPLRRALLNEMSETGRTLAYLVRRTGAAPSRVSNHLRLMEQARLVRTRQRSGGRIYYLRKEGLRQVLAFLNSLVDPSLRLSDPPTRAAAPGRRTGRK